MDSSHHQIRSCSLPKISKNRHHLGRNLWHLSIKTFWQHPDSMLQSSLSKMMPQHLVRVAVFVEKRPTNEIQRWKWWPFRKKDGSTCESDIKTNCRIYHMRFIKGMVCYVRMILSVANGTSPCLSGSNWVWWMGIFPKKCHKDRWIQISIEQKSPIIAAATNSPQTCLIFTSCSRQCWWSG